MDRIICQKELKNLDVKLKMFEKRLEKVQSEVKLKDKDARTH